MLRVVRHSLLYLEEVFRNQVVNGKNETVYNVRLMCLGQIFIDFASKKRALSGYLT